MPTTFSIYAGTIGFAVLVLIAGWFALGWVMRLLPEDDHDDHEAGVRGVWPSGQVAADRPGDHNRALLTLQQDVERRRAQQRRDAADREVFDAIKRGQVGPPATGAVPSSARVVALTPKRSA
jgi:hypothetical protein